MYILSLQITAFHYLVNIIHFVRVLGNVHDVLQTQPVSTE